MRVRRHTTAVAALACILSLLATPATGQDDPAEARTRLVVVGGEDAVSASVVDAAAAAGGTDAARLAGPDRFTTAAAVADRFPVGSPVVIASGRSFPDALAGGPLAAVDGAPVLLVEPDLVPAATSAALVDLEPSSLTVLGGTAAVSDGVVAEVEQLTGLTADRIAGPDRFTTAAAVADRFDAPREEVWIASGEVFPDALVGAAAAGAVDAPILLVRRDEVPDATAEALARLAPDRIVVLGGTAAVSAEVEAELAASAAVERLAGPSRFETAVTVALASYPDGAPVVYLATGGDFADALAVAPLAGGATGGFSQAADGAGPVLLTPTDALPPVVADAIRTLLDGPDPDPTPTPDPDPGADDRPTVADLSATTGVGVPVDVTLEGEDADGDDLSYSVIDPPDRGTATIVGDVLTYTPDGGDAYTTTLTYTADDGELTAEPATITITVTAAAAPANQAPRVDLQPGGPTAPDTAGTHVEDGGAVTLAPAATVTDPDGATLAGLTLTLSPTPDGADEQVAATAAAAITVAPYDPATGELVLTGLATVSDYEAALRTAAYLNVDQDPDPVDRTVEVVVTDSRGRRSVPVQVVVTVVPVDDVPTAVSDSATVAEDSGPTSVDVLANDTDVDAGPIAIGSVTQPANGTVVITGGGTGLTYAPDLDLCTDPPGTTPDTFGYTLAPGGSSTTVAVTVTCVDDAPIAVADAATVVEDAPATPIDVLANELDTDGGPAAVSAVTQPANGTVVITGGGTGLTYAPNANYCNTPPGTALDTFTYTLTPGTSTATVSVTVTCVDDAPIAVADSATVAEDSGATAVDVLANDTDVDGGPIAVSAVTQSANGTVVITGGGTGLTYAPNANYCNTPPGTTLDPFTYTLAPGGSSTTVSMTVTCVDDAPTAVDDSATVAEDSGPTAVDVLANDTDVDAGPIAISAVTQPADGTVVITGGGTGLTYAPNLSYCNTPPGTSPDTFTYALAPGATTATVSMTVTCVDDAPIAVADVATAAQASGPNAIDVLANDLDPDGGPIAVASVDDSASNGTVVITGGGTGVTYEPDAGYCNDQVGGVPDTFTYTLAPGGSVGTVSVTVACDVPPVAVADSATVVEDSGATAIDVLANDTDVDGGPIAVSAVAQPADGTVVITGGGTGVTYAPNANYCSTPPGTTLDTFTYSLTPGTSTATVSMTVTCVDDAPVAVADSATVAEDSGATAVPVLANDIDVDGGPIAVSAVTQSANGTVVITGGGTGLTYAPNANYCNAPPGATPDAFTYSLAPGGSSTTVSVTVTCVDDAPVAGADTFDAIGNTGLFVGTTLPADQAGIQITGSLLANDTDVDSPLGDLVVEPVTGATTTLGGTITTFADGSFTYHPDDGDTAATDTFTYRVCDSSPCSAAVPSSSTGTLSLPIAGQVWYVDNTAAAGGDGTSDGPFDTLAEAESASGAGDTTYVFEGTGTSTNLGTGFVMDATSRLLGEHATLTLDADGVGPLPLRTLFPGTPDARPVLTAAGEDVVVLAASSFVSGITVDPGPGGGGIAGGIPAGGIAASSAAISGVRILDTAPLGTQPGLDLDGTTGTSTVSDLIVSTSGAVGVRLNAAGTVAFAPASIIEITTAGARGLEVTGTGLGASTFDAITVTGSTTGGVSLTNSPGTIALGDGIGNDLSLTTIGGAAPALAISGSGAITVPAAGTADLSATGGPALDVTGTPGASLNFDAVTSTGSANDGINLAGLGTGTFTAASGSIDGAAAVAFDLDGGGGTITYPGGLGNGAGAAADITNRNGGAVTLAGSIADSADAGGGITLSGNTAGSTTFSGAAKVISTGAADAVLMTASDGHTLTFSGGGLDIDTTSGRGLEASTSGILVVTGSNNSITSTTGRALNVTATDIGTGGLTFTSISSNGAPNGIVLNGTGTTAGLTVTGDAGTSLNGSGGLIQNATVGIALTSTQGVALEQLNVTTTADSAISGVGVNGFSYVSGVISGAGNGGIDSAIAFNGNGSTTGSNLTGALTVTGSTFVAPAYSGIDVQATAGTITSATVTGNTFVTPGFSGVNLVGRGTSTTSLSLTRATISGNLITQAGGAGIQVSIGNADPAGPGATAGVPGSATDVIAITRNGISVAPTGTQAIAVANSGGNPGSRTRTNLLIQCNGTVGGTCGAPGTLGSSAIGTAVLIGNNGHSTMTGTVDRNTIAGNHNVGGGGGNGIAGGNGVVGAAGAWTPNLSLAITGNVVTGVDGNGILMVGRGTQGTMSLGIRGNTVAAPLSGDRPGIRVDAGNTSSVDDAVCVDIRGNSSAGSGVAPEGIGIRKQGTDAAVNDFGISGLTPSPASGAVAAAFVAGLNPSSNGTLLISGNDYVSCSTAPVNAPLTPPVTVHLTRTLEAPARG